MESFSSTKTPADRGTIRGHPGYDPCGACQTTVNDVECWPYSVHVACPNEAASSLNIC
jgi:hypothetical protein